MVGLTRKDERLGDVSYKVQWRRNSGTASLGESEFAFGRCGVSVKEAVLMNRFNETAAKRARKIAESFREQLHLPTPPRPIGIYLLIFDSVSRQHFYRNFPETIQFLNDHTNSPSHSNLSLFDFIINNADGENTPPNMVSMLYGFDIAHLKTMLTGLSHQRPDHFQKYIDSQQHAMWKLMEKQGFVTMFGFDTIWDYLSPYTGRVVDTDHMVSNFFHAARRIFAYNEFSLTQRCLGCHNAHYYPLTYLSEYHDNYVGYNRFGYIHISTGHEHSGTVIKTADEDLKNTLEKMLLTNNPNEDFVLMIAADHGLHVGNWDQAYEGFVENQLPLHLLITNNQLLHRLGPDTMERLKHNSKRLVTRYDWYLTFRHLSTVPYGRLSADSELYNLWKLKTENSNAVSLLLEDIPDNRTCADVGIPMYYCSCLSFEELHVETAKGKFPVPEAIALTISFINEEIKQTSAETICQVLTVQDVTKVLEQKIDSNSYNYKIRFTINESSKAKFDAIVFVAPAEQFKELKIPENDFLHPVFTSESGAKIQVRLYTVKRTGASRRICRVLRTLSQSFRNPSVILHLQSTVRRLVPAHRKVSNED